MLIEKDKVVLFHYLLSDSQGPIEDSAQSEPMAYLHGHGNILPALEKSLEGTKMGESLQVTLEAKDAYGEVREDAEQRVPKKHLAGKKKWVKGMVASLQTDQGMKQVRIVKVGMHMVTIDTNHPLAGKTLTFDINIVDVRDGTNEEITHGHAHGIGGHHH
jgi:FKBP-type peptidyl-prolyl cis-trans isomerase SlyD